MTISIKLDAAAVRELFPEGSQARLDLSQSVIAETVRRLPAKSEIQDFTTRHVLQYFTNSALEKHMNNQSWGNSLSEKTKQLVQAEAASQFRKFSEDFVQKEMTKKVQEMKDSILSQLKLSIDNQLSIVAPFLEQEARRYIINHITNIVQRSGMQATTGE